MTRTKLYQVASIILLVTCLGAAPLYTSAKQPTAIRSPSIVDICELARTPGEFLNRRVQVSGIVFKGPDHMNIRGSNCIDNVIELAIYQKTTFERPDVRNFYKALGQNGPRINATITGRIRSTGERLTPYAVEILSIDAIESTKTGKSIE